MLIYGKEKLKDAKIYVDEWMCGNCNKENMNNIKYTYCNVTCNFRSGDVINIYPKNGGQITINEVMIYGYDICKSH